MATVLMLLPNRDFDPTEAGIPWETLTRLGHVVRFATPEGGVAQADARMVEGFGLGPWKVLLRADANGRRAHAAMTQDAAFLAPLRYAQAAQDGFDALLLPGGHAAGMREYLESEAVHAIIARAFARNLPVGAICHGVVAAARARGADGRSVLHGRKTTALTRTQELAAWLMTPWLGRYYRTYPETVQGEVTRALASRRDFQAGPPALLRDDPKHPERGFTVRDGRYLSARWPGDVHRFAGEFAELLAA